MNGGGMNELGYLIGEAHPRCTIPAELVEQARAMREQVPPVPYREIAARLRILSVRTLQGLCQMRKRAQMPVRVEPQMRHRHLRRVKRK